MKRKTLSVFFACLGLVLGLGMMSNAGARSGKELLEPLNPRYLEYINGRNSARAVVMKPDGSGVFQNGQTRRLNYIPPTVSFSHVRGVLDAAVQNVVYPVKYDLRQQGRASDVKNQLNYYTCWVFAAFASLESCRLPEEKLDFSEWHMAWTHGFNYNLEQGGNSLMTTAYVARWSGPVDEKDCPYGSGGVLGSNFPSSRHVQQVVFLPERTGPLDNDTIKHFLVNHGPVDFAYFWDNMGYRGDNSSMYIPGQEGQNHRLAIVGWDDNYPASNFIYRPAGNGAFIARNSWGSEWGDGGHCYISYHDMSIQQMMCFNNAENINNYGHVYQYDPLGFVSRWGGNVAWGANVFTAESRQPLQAVSFYAVHPFLNYEIRIYKNISGGHPLQGDAAIIQTGSLVYPGYFTIPLKEEVPVHGGEKFSVVVKFMYENLQHAVPVEMNLPNHSSNARANVGESFVSSDGENWSDLVSIIPNGNICVKAFSKYKQSYIQLQAERRVVRGWLLNAHYAKVRFSIDNSEGADIQRILLTRSVQGGEFKTLREITPGDLKDNMYYLEDKYLDPYTHYTYQVVIYESNDRINSKSQMVVI